MTSSALPADSPQWKGSKHTRAHGHTCTHSANQAWVEQQKVMCRSARSLGLLYLQSLSMTVNSFFIRTRLKATLPYSYIPFLHKDLSWNNRMAQLGTLLHIFISVYCVATVIYETITVNEAAKLKLWSGAGRNANELRCGGVKNVEGALSVTQTILKDCKKQWGRVQKPENIIFRKHPMVSKWN